MQEKQEIMKAPTVKNSVYLLDGDVRHLLTSLLISTARLLQQEQKHFKEELYTPGFQGRMQETSSSSDSIKDYFLQAKKQRCKQSRKS